MSQSFPSPLSGHRNLAPVSDSFHFERAARQEIQPDWNSFIFNYGRNEVRSFLVSNALFWLDTYHADGLRVDAVASILYLDYSRNDGEWIPNEHGGRENLEAIAFFRQLNESVYARFPDVQVIAEESTAWPMVSRPTYLGGLGFGMKWDMGWMHDTLDYMALDPIHRRHHHHQLTFRHLYANTENFMLSLSHDEVVHGKGSLYGKMPGELEENFSHLRLLLGYQYALSGKKLLFMGGEFGQQREWDHDRSLDWELTDTAFNAGVQRWVEDLNRLYRAEPDLHEQDCDEAKELIIDMSLNASGVRDTARSLHISTDAVLSKLKKKKTLLESVNTALLCTLNPDQVKVLAVVFGCRKDKAFLKLK